jgi:hypothetical protein
MALAQAITHTASTQRALRRTSRLVFMCHARMQLALFFKPVCAPSTQV